MIELLLAVALATAVPIGAVRAASMVGVAGRGRAAIVAASLLAAGAMAGDRGLAAGGLAVAWVVVAAGLVAASVASLARHRRDRILQTGLGLVVAMGFLLIGAIWLEIDRLGLRPFGLPTVMVLLTPVHFHVAGFVLTLAGVLARDAATTRRLEAIASISLTSLVVGTPLTAAGILASPIVGWIGAVLVAAGGIGIAIVQIAAARAFPDGLDRAALRIGGATLFVTLPLAVVYASGAAFGIPSLGLPAMAAIHGTLNIAGFAIPSMVGWSRVIP